MTDLERYKEACNYPGNLDEKAVTRHLKKYVKALGIKRDIVRLGRGWSALDHKPIMESVEHVMSSLSDKGERFRRSPAALQSFAAWVVNGGWWSWDMSWLAVTAIGAKQLKKKDVLKWSKPCLEAFKAGAWIFYWTESTLFWFSKPTLHVERFESGARRLHRDDGPAVESDLEDLYFWHGVLVPGYVVTNPERIRLERIEKEGNAEVRRVMIERYGAARYVLDSGVKPVHSDDYGTLYVKPESGDLPALAVVKVVNSTPEQDGTFKDYWLRVHPELRPMIHKGLTWLQGGADPKCEQPESGDFVLGGAQELTARNAVASTFGLRGSEYAPSQET